MSISNTSLSPTLSENSDCNLRGYGTSSLSLTLSENCDCNPREYVSFKFRMHGCHGLQLTRLAEFLYTYLPCFFKVMVESSIPV